MLTTITVLATTLMVPLLASSALADGSAQPFNASHVMTHVEKDGPFNMWTGEGNGSVVGNSSSMVAVKVMGKNVKALTQSRRKTVTRLLLRSRRRLLTRINWFGLEHSPSRAAPVASPVPAAVVRPFLALIPPAPRRSHSLAQSTFDQLANGGRDTHSGNRN